MCVLDMLPASATGCCSCGESKAGDNAGTECHHWGNSVTDIYRIKSN